MHKLLPELTININQIYYLLQHQFQLFYAIQVLIKMITNCIVVYLYMQCVIFAFNQHYGSAGGHFCTQYENSTSNLNLPCTGIMNHAFGFVGYSQPWQWPWTTLSQCPWEMR